MAAISNGTVNQNVEPPPSSLVTPMIPPIKSTSFLQIDSPSPVPSCMRVGELSACTKGLNKFGITCSAIPIPESVTEKRTI